MSWRGSSGRSLPNGSLTLPFSRSLLPPLSWVEGGGARDQALLLDEEEGWTGNQTLSSSSSSSSSFQEEWCHMSPTASVCLVVCYCLTLLLGLVGNCFLIGMIARRRERANVTSVLIANLSVSDILVCAFCLPFTVTYTLMDHWVFGSALCRLVPFVQCVSVTVSILSLVLIALERHQLIINPSGWRPSVPQAYGAVVVIWVLACLTSLPFLAFHLLTSEPHAILSRPLAPPPSVPSRQPLPSLQPRDLEPSLGPEPYAPLWPSSPPQPPPYSQISPSPPPYSQTSPSPPPHSQTSPSPPPYSQTLPSPSPPKRPFPSPKLHPPAPPRYPLPPQALPHMEVCMEHWPSQQHKLAYTTWLLLFQYCVPLFLVLLCYVRVYVRLRRRRHMLDRTRTPENQRVSHSRRVNVMLVALVTAFTLCWLPLTVFNAVSDWYHEALPVCHHDLLFSLCHLLAMLSTCVNPVIYGFLNSNFRQEVREGLLHCRCRPLEDSYRHFPLSTVQTEVSRASTSLRLNCRSNSV